MQVSVRLGPWEALREAAQPLRYEVFVVEQNVPVELEWDEMDASSIHAIAVDESGKVVATGRLLPDGHIGRMAVLREARGKGVGTAVLQALVDAARSRGDAAVMLSAQTHALDFYARHGFVQEGDEYMEAGIAHVAMRRSLR